MSPYRLNVSRSVAELVWGSKLPQNNVLVALAWYSSNSGSSLSSSTASHSNPQCDSTCMDEPKNCLSRDDSSAFSASSFLQAPRRADPYHCKCYTLDSAILTINKIWESVSLHATLKTHNMKDFGTRTNVCDSLFEADYSVSTLFFALDYHTSNFAIFFILVE